MQRAAAAERPQAPSATAAAPPAATLRPAAAGRAAAARCAAPWRCGASCLAATERRQLVAHAMRCAPAVMSLLVLVRPCFLLCMLVRPGSPALLWSALLTALLCAIPCMPLLPAALAFVNSHMGAGCAQAGCARACPHGLPARHCPRARSPQALQPLTPTLATGPLPYCGVRGGPAGRLGGWTPPVYTCCLRWRAARGHLGAGVTITGQAANTRAPRPCMPPLPPRAFGSQPVTWML